MYDERNSTTFKFFPAIYDFHYGIGNTYGFNSFDKICVRRDVEICSDGFSHFLIVSQVSLDNMIINGLVGLSPYASNQSRNDLLVDKLK